MYKKILTVAAVLMLVLLIFASMNVAVAQNSSNDIDGGDSDEDMINDGGASTSGEGKMEEKGGTERSRLAIS